ncbi:MAG: hypothetical protein FWG83_03780 [Oscillospiraceae bacterium]|nr:hypothetical protein [Oscillospiraceae bacterium]
MGNITLGKKEQIALFAVVFIALAVAGFFIFLSPVLESINSNEEKRDARKKHFEEREQALGLQAFRDVETIIKVLHAEGKEAATVFYDEYFTNYDADRLVRRVLSEKGFETDNLSFNNVGRQQLGLTKSQGTGVSGDDRAEIGESPNAEGAESAVFRNKAEAWRYFTTQEVVTPEVVEIMRDYLAQEVEELHVLRAEFEIPLTQEEAWELSMLVYKLMEWEVVGDETLPYGTTYISAMEASDTSTNVSSAMEIKEGARFYKVVIEFYIFHPLPDNPDTMFGYENKFEWGKN